MPNVHMHTVSQGLQRGGIREPQRHAVRTLAEASMRNDDCSRAGRASRADGLVRATSEESLCIHRDDIVWVALQSGRGRGRSAPCNI